MSLLNAVKFVEGGNLTIDLSEGRLPFPYPEFTWTLDGVLQTNDSRRTFHHYGITINNVTRSDAGNYSVVLTNHFLNQREILGTSGASFFLDILCESEAKVGFKNLHAFSYLRSH